MWGENILRCGATETTREGVECVGVDVRGSRGRKGRRWNEREEIDRIHSLVSTALCDIQTELGCSRMGKKRDRGRTNINSLPVELIDLIVTQVDELVRDDRDPRHALAEAANLAGDAGIEAGLMALFGGFLGGGFQPPRAPVRAPTPPPVPSRPEEEDGELPLHDEVDSEESSESEDEQEEDDEDGYDSDGEPLKELRRSRPDLVISPCCNFDLSTSQFPGQSLGIWKVAAFDRFSTRVRTRAQS